MLKYLEIVADICRRIDAGEYENDSKIPSVAELCAHYGVSKITVNKALNDLVQMGIVTRRRGAGTFVKAGSLGPSAYAWSEATRIDGTTAHYAGQGKTVNSRVIDFSVVDSNAEVRTGLGIDGGFVYHICRVRLIDHKPVVVEYTYMPVALFPDMTREVVEGSIYHYIENTLGMQINSAHSAISAVRPTENEQEWLAVGPDEPLLEVKQVAYLSDGRAFEYSTARHTADFGPVNAVRFRR